MLFKGYESRMNLFQIRCNIYTKRKSKFELADTGGSLYFSNEDFESANAFGTLWLEKYKPVFEEMGVA